MAYHFIRHVMTGDEKTIRTESLPAYKASQAWRIFDTDAARREAFPVAQWWVTMLSSGQPPSKITPTQAVLFWTRPYLEAGYSLHATREAAAGIARSFPVRFGIDPATGECRQLKGWLPADHEGQPGPEFIGSFASVTEAIEAHPAPLFALHPSTGNERHLYEHQRRNYEADGWIVRATNAECVAALPIRWQHNGDGYVRVSRGNLMDNPSRFAATRAAFRAAVDGETYFRIEARRHYRMRDREVTDAIRDLIATLCAYGRGRTRAIGVRETSNAFYERLADRLNTYVLRVGNPCFTFATCGDCRRAITCTLFSTQENSDGDPLCEACNRNYVNCNNCDVRLHSDDMMIGDDDASYCADCHDDYGSGEVGQMLSYSTDVTKRREGFLKTKADRSPLWLGWELEVHRGEHVRSTRDAVSKVQLSAAKAWAIVKDDGSLNDGLEIVSVPASLAWHRENVAPWLGQMAGILSGWQHTDCGIHIHVGKKELSELTQGKLVAWMHEEENQPFITHIAGRDPGNYCQRGSRKKSIPAYRREAGIGRYQAINFATRGNHTIEFRIFRSNVSPAGFMKNLDFVHALCSWARDASMLEVISNPSGIKGKREGVTAHGAFVQYVLRNRSSYPALVRWLEEQDYLPKPKAHPDFIRAPIQAAA